MNQKEKLMEATMKALQGKLLNESAKNWELDTNNIGEGDVYISFETKGEDDETITGYIPCFYNKDINKYEPDMSSLYYLQDDGDDYYGDVYDNITIPSNILNKLDRLTSKSNNKDNLTIVNNLDNWPEGFPLIKYKGLYIYEPFGKNYNFYQNFDKKELRKENDPNIIDVEKLLNAKFPFSDRYGSSYTWEDAADRFHISVDTLKDFIKNQLTDDFKKKYLDSWNNYVEANRAK